MIQGIETEVLAALHDVLSADTRRLSRLPPTKKLAYMLGRSVASLIETPLRSKGMPNGGLSFHCSREISGAQVTRKGDSRHATSSLPR